MDWNGRYTRPIVLVSLIILIIPMVLFPNRLGTDLARASLIYLMYELVWYMLAAFALTRRPSLLPLAQAAGVCLVYRLVLGLAFGVMIGVAYAMNLRVSLTLGMSSYLPAVLLHVIAAPFVMIPVIRQVVTPKPTRPVLVTDQPGTNTPVGDGKTTFLTGHRREHTELAGAGGESGHAAHSDADTAVLRPGEANGFDRATQYIGENADVRVAAVVDNEGLLLGHFQRGGDLAEDWAPLALLFFEQNQPVVKRFSDHLPQRIIFSFPDRKVVIAREEMFYLMVVSERHHDELLNIRFSQGLEIVKKYVAERYGNERAVNAENEYVRNS